MGQFGNAKSSLLDFINKPDFPCVMAKAIASKGVLTSQQLAGHDVPTLAGLAKNHLYSFITRFQIDSSKLSTFSLSFTDEKFRDFNQFEIFFWEFIRELDFLDKQVFSSDPRVSGNPASKNFSFSLRGEAFFLVVLHPESPRMARQFEFPTIVFNAHSQFEDLRKKGVFTKIRDLIRKRDQDLQGFINPMLDDHGVRSEAFQYIGKKYNADSKCPFLRFQNWINGSSLNN